MLVRVLMLLLSLALACTIELFPADGHVVLKPLSGIEAMQCIGWDKRHWRAGWQDASPYQRTTDVQLRRMAGNAFSGFVMAPVLSAALACRGLVCSEEDRSHGNDYANRAYDLFATQKGCECECAVWKVGIVNHGFSEL